MDAFMGATGCASSHQQRVNIINEWAWKRFILPCFYHFSSLWCCQDDSFIPSYNRAPISFIVHNVSEHNVFVLAHYNTFALGGKKGNSTPTLPYKYFSLPHRPEYASDSGFAQGWVNVHICTRCNKMHSWNDYKHFCILFFRSLAAVVPHAGWAAWRHGRKRANKTIFIPPCFSSGMSPGIRIPGIPYAWHAAAPLLLNNK